MSIAKPKEPSPWAVPAAVVGTFAPPAVGPREGADFDLDLDLEVDDSDLISAQPAAAPAAPRPAGAAPAAAPAKGVEGSLAEFSVLELTQMFSSSNRTGEFRVTSPEGVGQLYLQDGRVYAAYWEGHGQAPVAGMEAVGGLAGVKQGDFSFGPIPGTGPAENLALPTTSLLIILATGGAVEERADERPEAADPFASLDDLPFLGEGEVPATLADPFVELPSPFDDLLHPPPVELGPRYRLAHPLPGRLSTLSTLELDALQLVYDLGAVEEIEDAALRSAMELLVRRGFVTRS